MNTQIISELFAGKSNIFGGLSNEDELAKLCPEEFKQTNEWSDYITKLFFEGAYIANWQWKTSDEDERIRQMACLSGLLGTFGLRHQDKEAVAGWMLSEMLSEVPEWVPPKDA